MTPEARRSRIRQGVAISAAVVLSLAVIKSQVGFDWLTKANGDGLWSMLTCPDGETLYFSRPHGQGGSSAVRRERSTIFERIRADWRLVRFLDSRGAEAARQLPWDLLPDNMVCR